MKSLYKILSLENQQAQRYFKNYIFYARKIKDTVKDLLSDAKVLVFGSIIRGNYRLDSDIDILIISSQIPKDIFEKARIKVKIKEKFPYAPFEIHLATSQIYENWYKKFIKDDYINI